MHIVFEPSPLTQEDSSTRYISPSVGEDYQGPVHSVAKKVQLFIVFFATE